MFVEEGEKMTYRELMESLRPMLREAYQDGKKGIVYAKTSLPAYEEVYAAQNGHAMDERTRKLCACVDYLMNGANQKGLEKAGKAAGI